MPSFILGAFWRKESCLLGHDGDLEPGRSFCIDLMQRGEQIYEPEKSIEA